MKPLLLLVVSLTLMANSYAVVSKKNMPEVSLGQLRALYLKKSSYINTLKIVPLNLGARDNVRRSFEKNILHMSFTRLKSYWIQQHYLGHRPPISLKSQQSIISFVKKVDGAIGYIEMKNLDDDLHILYRWEE